MTKETKTLPIICPRTGLVIGAITVEKVAGFTPFLKEWDNTIVLHPLFSLTPIAMLNFAKNTWLSFCGLTEEQAANKSLTDRQEQLLQVSALAMLHQLTEVDQQIPWLPSLADVSSCWTQILQLSYWKHYLESKRFQFPRLRINKLNNGISLHSFLQDCWAVKKDYESKVRERDEIEQLKVKDAAVKAVRDELAGKAPRSKKLLWRWFITNMPAKYDRDINGWMWELFDAETDEELDEFTLADIDLFEEIVLSELELGSTLSHAFLDRIATKRKKLATKKDFEILIPESITQGKQDGTISAVEPKKADFPNNVKFIIAHAKWKLAYASSQASGALQAEKERQKTITVKHSYQAPSFQETSEEDDELPELDTNTDEPITGETEE